MVISGEIRLLQFDSIWEEANDWNSSRQEDEASIMLSRYWQLCKELCKFLCRKVYIIILFLIFGSSENFKYLRMENYWNFV